MAGNSFGEIYRVTTFGESHGTAIGVVIDGCPPLLKFDIDFISNELQRRKPGQSAITTDRKEDEAIEIISGVFDGFTTGAPICMLVHNKDQQSGDYDALKDVFRPSHADYSYEKKYGIRDHRGSGRASARETIARVMAGALAKLYLIQMGIQIQAYVSQVGNIQIEKDYQHLDLSQTEKSMVRCPDEATASKMIELIADMKQKGDSVGGKISCVIKGIPAGLGEPVFDKLHADLGKGVLSINACKGFEIGSGFSGAYRKGSEENDAWEMIDNKVSTKTNNSGGIQGGISNGMDIYFDCAFKPVSTISLTQETINTHNEPTTLQAKGRHDPCVLPRAVPIVESMAAIVLMDHYLRHKMYS